MREYWKRIFGRAWADALGASGWKGTSNLTFKAASLIVVLAVLFVIFKDYSGTVSLAEKTLGGIVAFVLVLLSFFLTYMFLAPFRIDRDLRAELAELKSERQQRLSFGPAEIFESQATASAMAGPALVLRIAVENISDMPAVSCRARLINVEFGAADVFKATKYSDVLALPWRGKSEGAEIIVTIAPRLREWLEIAEISARAGFQLRSVPASPQHGHLLAKEGLYRFTVRVDADGCEPITELVTVAVAGLTLKLNGQAKTLKMDW
jgi:hypothetical protein